MKKTGVAFLMCLMAFKTFSQSQSMNTASVANCLCTGDLWDISIPYQPKVTFSAPGHSHRLMFTNYGFTIPSTATITGVQVNFSYTSNASNATLRDTTVMLLVGTYLAGYTQALSTPNYIGNSAVSIGGPLDTWGTYLGPNDVNDSGFGFNFKLISQLGGVNFAFVNGATITVFYILTNGIKESQSMMAQTKIYASGKQVTLTSDLQEPAEVTIYSMTGTKLTTFKLNPNSTGQLDISDYSPGIYIYTIKSKSDERSGKLIIN
jgi:hypothetical protein